jgi:hypothetical protein
MRSGPPPITQRPGFASEGSDVPFPRMRFLRLARVSIAFPQRDVHLSAAEPLDVRLHQGPTEAPTPNS